MIALWQAQSGKLVGRLTGHAAPIACLAADDECVDPRVCKLGASVSRDVWSTGCRGVLYAADFLGPGTQEGWAPRMRHLLARSASQPLESRRFQYEARTVRVHMLSPCPRCWDGRHFRDWRASLASLFQPCHGAAFCVFVAMQAHEATAQQHCEKSQQCCGRAYRRRCELISLSTDHVVKVWDLRANKCRQTISPEDWPKGEDARPTAAAFDAQRGRLVTACKKPAVWENRRVAQESTGHRAPVVKAIYNAAFSVVVSADERARLFP
jgi:hypothetical protein